MRIDLAKASPEQLVARFVEIGIAQSVAMAERNTSKYNRLFDKEAAVLRELKARPGDQRRLLFPLYNHENIQVRLNAAKSTYALDPAAAWAAIQAIADSRRFPWAGDAGMTLSNLDMGIARLD
jgi:hypothetical protein